MHTDSNDPPKIAYSIKQACKASSLGRTTLYAHIAANRPSASADAPSFRQRACTR